MEKIKVRCRTCGKELEANSGKTYSCGFYSKLLPPAARKGSSSYAKEIYAYLLNIAHFSYIANNTDKLYLVSDSKSAALYCSKSQAGHTSSIYDRLVAKLSSTPFKFIITSYTVRAVSGTSRTAKIWVGCESAIAVVRLTRR